MGKKANDAFHESNLLVEIKVVFNANIHEMVDAYNHYRDKEYETYQPNYVQRAPSPDEKNLYFHTNSFVRVEQDRTS